MTHIPLPPFVAYSGSRKPKMLLVGEAFGESEAQLKRPFVGESGKLLWLMLGEAMPLIEPELHEKATQLHKYGLAWVGKREDWLNEAGIGMTNVLALRPPGNKLDELCLSKKELDKPYAYPPLALGKYLRSDYLPELDRLHSEINSASPNLVVALGNTACWALLRATNIGSIRGTITAAHPNDNGNKDKSFAGRNTNQGIKCLATYHPAGVMRQWAWRPIVVADLMKASREAEWPEIRRPKRRVKINPTLEEIESWTTTTLSYPEAILACDIETAKGMITCIGFGRSNNEAIVIPLANSTQGDGSYWRTNSDEEKAWNLVSLLLSSHNPKLFQNGLYDLQYICSSPPRGMGMKVNNVIEDSMLLHHSIFPELQKGLGFLASIYSSESSWKLMRKRKADTDKADE
jgi:uracil-DNA glycosylase